MTALPKVNHLFMGWCVGRSRYANTNSNAAVNVVSNVNSFSLLYDKKSVVAPTTYSSSATSTLYSYSNVLPIVSSALNVAEQHVVVAIVLAYAAEQCHDMDGNQCEI